MIIKKERQMNDSEYAKLAARCPEGFTPAICANGALVFFADSALEEMKPSERAALTLVRSSRSGQRKMNKVGS
jgi:hypothetical protein